MSIKLKKKTFIRRISVHNVGRENKYKLGTTTQFLRNTTITGRKQTTLP